MAGNKNLNDANRAKNDEFYTQLSDIENELRHYKEHFKGKTVLCNCDDPRVSNFVYYFLNNFEQLGLKKLIASCYKNQNRDLLSQNVLEKAIYLEYIGDRIGNRVPNVDEIGIKNLKGDGDFRSAECIELLKQADIVVTNPPFSLFRKYVAQLVKYDKKFIIMGNIYAVGYKELFPLIKENKMRLGYTTPKLFRIPASEEGKSIKIIAGVKYQQFGNIAWFTNLDIQKRHEDMILYKNYTPEEYLKFDNYDAINVDKTCDIPKDYDGIMGVPITFMDKYNPEQFEIVKFRKGDDNKDLSINGKYKYFRILIRKIK